MSNLPTAKIIDSLPCGDMGVFSVCRRGVVEGIENEVALKISRQRNQIYEVAFKQELERSIQLHDLLPNSIAYHSMVDIVGYVGSKRLRIGSEGFHIFVDEDYTGHPAIAMDLVRGRPIIDINITVVGTQKLKDVLFGKAVDQLKSNLELAAANGWHTDDVQYFVLTQDQILGGRNYCVGDIVLFDFGDWRKVDHQIDFSKPVKNLTELVRRLDYVRTLSGDI